MKEVIEWDKSGINIRLAVVELCRWTTNKGTISRTGKKIARTGWEELSTAAQNVLSQHGIKP